MNFINKDTIRGAAFGAGLGLLAVTSYSWAEPPAATLRPNGGVGSDSKAMLGATRLFKVENCEVWGFTWKDQARVVSVCPAPVQVVAVVDPKTTTPPTVPGGKSTAETKPTPVAPVTTQVAHK